MNDSRSSGRREPHYRIMTVAHVREPEGTDHVEVVFLESARFYRLARRNPAYRTSLELLKTAASNREVVTVRLPSIDSDVIEEVSVGELKGGREE